MSRNMNGPTARIIAKAEASPGGVIRWREAEAQYIAGSPKARRHWIHGERNHCMWVKGVLDRHFVKVEGVRGYYVLYNRTLSEDPDGCLWLGETPTKKDRRVRLLSTDDPWTRLRPGTEGTVVCTDSIGTLHVRWDTGESLGLVPGHDHWEEVR